MIAAMALRIAGLSLPGPSETLSAAVSLAGVPGRLGRLLSEVEALLARIDRVVDAAATAAATAQQVADQARRIVDAYAPLAGKAAPLAEQFVNELSPHEVHAAVRLVDLLPTLSTYMERDIVPALGQTDRRSGVTGRVGCCRRRLRPARTVEALAPAGSGPRHNAETNCGYAS